MLSYQHGYHAGNLADVHKHAVLSLVLEYLRRKPKPFSCLDLYAGRGRYDLESDDARRTGEAEQGIHAVWARPWPALLGDYRQVLKALNPHRDRVRFYPGSPWLMQALSRPDCPVVLCELHPQEHGALVKHLGDQDRVHIHRRDAREALTALLPPPVRRGLVLVDPSYEEADAYERVAESVRQGLTRWPTGMFLVWYPLLADQRHRRLLRALSSVTSPALRAELLARPRGMGMHGSGMLVINPPYVLADQLDRLRPFFAALGEQGTATLDLSESISG